MTDSDSDRRGRSADNPLSSRDFKDELARVIPHLRAFGRSLTGNRDLADDLVQETLLRAWRARDRFEAGTSMRAWTFIILRNHYFSYLRRAKLSGERDGDPAEHLSAAPASQDGQVHLADVQRALLLLPQQQREALVLVGAGGFSYEEAAAICGVALGTIKSRVARGRSALETLLARGDLAPRSQSAGGDAVAAIMQEVDDLAGDDGIGGRDGGRIGNEGKRWHGAR